MKTKEHWLLPIIARKRNDLLSRAIRLFLFLPALVYRLVIAVRNWAYSKGVLTVNRTSVPVISVGNLTTGGTGKTPIVMWLTQWLKPQCNTAIVSRGYRSLPGASNDEGMEIARNSPNAIQVQDKDRVAAAESAISQLATAPLENSVIILDDGFQHRRLHRDLDIVLIDATLPFGYGKLLPSGLLREPVNSLKRADAVVLTRANLVPQQTRDSLRTRVSKVNPDLVWAESELACVNLLDVQGRHSELSHLLEKRVVAFCGIGNPTGFIETLEREKLQPQQFLTFPDHHHYTPDDIDSIITAGQRNRCDAILCTVKDLVKLPVDYAYPISIFAVQTEPQITVGKTEFCELIRTVIG